MKKRTKITIELYVSGDSDERADELATMVNDALDDGVVQDALRDRFEGTDYTWPEIEEARGSAFVVFPPVARR